MAFDYLPVVLAGNPVTEPVDRPAGTSGNGLRYFADLFVNNGPGTVHSQVNTIEAREKPGVPGAVFRIDSVLADNLQLSPPVPGQAAILPAASLLKSFYCHLRVESSDAEPLYAADSPVRYALKAGLNYADYSENFSGFFTGYQREAKQFLTWQPNFKETDELAPEYLYFLVNFTPLPQTLHLRCQVTYAATGLVEIVTPLTLSGITQHTVYAVPVGMHLFPNKVLSAYSVWLENESNERVSEIRTYRVNRPMVGMSTRREPQYIIFANSLGGYDTLHCTGNYEETIQATQEVYERILPATYAVMEGERSLGSASFEQEHTLYSGFKKRDYLDYLQELYLSEDIYLYDPNRSHQFIPVERTEKNLLTRERDVSLRGVKIKFRRRYTERHYSRLPRLYYSAAISGEVQKNDCPPNYTGSVVPYRLAAAQFSSQQSQADADAIALAYFNARKQAYANANGTCTPPPNQEPIIERDMSTLRCEQTNAATRTNSNRVTAAWDVNPDSPTYHQYLKGDYTPRQWTTNLTEAGFFYYDNNPTACPLPAPNITPQALISIENSETTYPDQNGSVYRRGDVYIILRHNNQPYNTLEALNVLYRVQVNDTQQGNQTVDGTAAVPAGQSRVSLGQDIVLEDTSYNSEGQQVYRFTEQYSIRPGSGYTT